jgi:predicted small metal-binding protein
MSWELRCGQVVPGCEGVVRSETRDGVMSLAAAHAADAHGLTEIDAETERALVAALQER